MKSHLIEMVKVCFNGCTLNNEGPLWHLCLAQRIKKRICIFLSLMFTYVLDNSKIFLPSPTHPILNLRHNLFMYLWVHFPFLKWKYTPQPDWGLSMPLNPYVPLLLLLTNLRSGPSAWISLSHRWCCHCMFITHSAWPWEHAWTQDMTGDTHTHTHTPS